MKKKTLYLNRTLLLIVMVGYSAFLVLMLLMDWYLIRNYQMENEKAEQRVVTSYISKIQDSMDKIDRQLSDIYADDGNFQNLQKNQKEVEEYGSAYELKESLRKRMLVDENLSGFYIFYNGKQKVWYQTNTDKISAQNSRIIKDILQQHIANNENERSWFSITIEEDNYLAIDYEKENAAIFGIYSMQNVDTVIHESMGKDVQIILEEFGAIKKNEELGKKLNLESYIKESSDEFHEIIQNYRVYGHRIPNMEMWMCVVYPIRFWDMMNVQQLLLLLLTGVSVIAVVVMYFFMRKQVVQPLHQLTDNMNAIRRGEDERISPIVCRFYEIQEADETLGEMVEELKKQKLLVYEEIIEKQKAQMQYLQLQLKPHFYLNGLKTLNALAMENQTGKMQDLILNLSKHLRYLLQAERELVPLYMELDFVENYVAMQKHVSGRPVSCEINKDGDVDNWMVPILAVQTFVENSVKYARLGGSSMPLLIQITASCLQTEEGNFLDLIVQDNGYGYPEEILEEINGDASSGNRCVGINNIKRRCKILYGERAEYSFANCDGALSELIIPERSWENERTVSG